MTSVVPQDEQPISRTFQYRKVMKPMLERKRRARINSCLDELKELLVGALQAEGESVSRLEKADVLELTVRHLHKLRRIQQFNETSASERFKAGFISCTNEVSKYISNLPSSVDMSVSARLLAHLDQCIRQIEAQTAAASANAAAATAANMNLIPNGPLSSSSSTSTLMLPMRGQMSQLSPMHHFAAAAAAAAAAAGASSPASASTLSVSSSYNSLSSSTSSGGSSSLSPTAMHSSSSSSHGGGGGPPGAHTRTSPNLNLLTTYTPPTSPASSSPLNKLMYHPYAAAVAAHQRFQLQRDISVGAGGGVEVVGAGSQVLLKSPSPAHMQNSHIFNLSLLNSAANANSTTSQQVPLSLCTKPSPPLRMDRNNNDEPFDLSNGDASMWRPW